MMLYIERERQRQRDRERQRETERDTERDREREREMVYGRANRISALTAAEIQAGRAQTLFIERNRPRGARPLGTAAPSPVDPHGPTRALCKARPTPRPAHSGGAVRRSGPGRPGPGSGLRSSHGQRVKVQRVKVQQVQVQRVQVQRVASRRIATPRQKGKGGKGTLAVGAPVAAFPRHIVGPGSARTSPPGPERNGTDRPLNRGQPAHGQPSALQQAGVPGM